MENTLDKMFKNSSNFKEYSKSYFSYLSELLQGINPDSLDQFCNILVDAYKNGKKTIFIGNGGSAATASHFANDFAIGLRKTPAFKAVSLTDNNAAMTAIANDFGYDQLFTKQLESTLDPNDIVVLISASGNSQNLIEAAKYARSKNNKVVSLLGFDGGKLKDMSDIAIVIECPKGEYGPVEDIHMVLDHLTSTYLQRYLF